MNRKGNENIKKRKEKRVKARDRNDKRKYSKIALKSIAWSRCVQQN